jgi:divalent metal cation (Fe/Co/Zn/Cd) transporter
MAFAAATTELGRYASIRRIQMISVVWMSVEVLVSLVAAVRSQSVVLAAFGGDSVIELASALLVLFHFSSAFLSERVAAKTAAILLYLLAAFIVVASILSLMGFWLEPQPSYLGMTLLVAAGFIMPWLAVEKRRLARESGSTALAADATQSTVCGWLSWIALGGLAMNAIFGLSWADEIAALALVPLVVKEGRLAWQNKGCHCC